MNPEHLQLWQKLESLDLDGDAALSFSKRLARDNGWSHAFALRVVFEYKRFLFLAATAGHPVTPSDEVDQAWHLHLVYTRSYWDELCGEIMGFPLHHGPTKGGAQEGAKFGDWYERTLCSYREAFGNEPPRDVWPDARVRFGQASGFRRVNLHRVWVVRKPFDGSPALLKKPAFSKRLRQFAPALGLLFLAGCAEAQRVGPNVFNWHGEAFLSFFWTLSIVGIAFAVWRKQAAREPLDAVFPIDPLDAYEVARLRDGKNLAVDVALATLWEKGALEVTSSNKLRATGRALAPLHRFESAVLSRIERSSSGETSVQSVRRELEAQTGAIDDKLRSLGLLCGRETQKHADDWPLGITLGLIGIGVIKIIVGLSRERPVGFLAVSCVLLACLFCYFLSHPARRSKRGDLLLEHLNRTRSVRAPMGFGVPSSPGSGADARRAGDFDSLALGFALAGTAAFPMEMQRAMRPPSGGSDGGSGCSSSGGDGDGGGGGCGGGGCGGCGS